MSGRVSGASSNGLAWGAAVGAIAVALLLPEPAAAQMDSLGRGASRGQAPAVGGVVPSPSTLRPPRPAVDILNLRDRIETIPTTVTAVDPTSASILCVAGCDTPSAKVVYQGSGALLPSLAVVGPIQPAASAPAVASAPVPAAPATAIVVCIAGCYENDRRSTLATGGPIAPAVVVAMAPRALPRVAEEPSAARPMSPRTAAPVLKRTLAAHNARAVATKSPASAVTPAPSLAAVGVPTPAAPRPEGAVARKRPALRPAAVATKTDWFNRINKERLAKPADAEAH